MMPLSSFLVLILSRNATPPHALLARSAPQLPANRDARQLTWIKRAIYGSTAFDMRQWSRRRTCEDAAMQQGLPMRLPTALRPFRDRKLLEGVISRMLPFRELPHPDLDTLAAYAQLREFRRGATIARRGEPFPGVIALVEGSAKLALRRNDGEEKVARILEPGECFGFAAMLLQSPCPVDVVALQNCVVATIPAMPILRLMEQHANFAVAM